MLNLLWLHGSGWDEFALLGGAVLLAFVIVKVTTRGDESDPDTVDPPVG